MDSSGAAGAGIGAAFLLVWGLFMLVGVAGAVFWIWQLVTLLQVPDVQFRAAGTEKVTWGLVVGLLGWIGALVWWFGPRQRVLAAVGALPTASPGWFPDPSGSGRLRWFDGAGWTEHLS